ncbi:hypothetical protein TNCV_5085651 [Trichonephila clavipes]|uniref:Uncharacterized protein n=1 Tax=Trichonephila clavipes TaxID=2585209 RepID=A0A8X6S9X6_TRICX|nr:hypothetical protein TNCV_5085651 [Trichonephila clavipes]
MSSSYYNGCFAPSLQTQCQIVPKVLEREKSHYKAAQGLLPIDLIILNHDQETRMTPELALTLLTSAPHQQEGVGASTYLTYISPHYSADLERYSTRTHDKPATSWQPSPVGCGGHLNGR